MWALSAAAEAELATSHTALTWLDVIRSGQPTHRLVAEGGTTRTEARRPVMRNLSYTVSDPTGELSEGDIGDLLNPYECEIAVHRGVQIPAPPGAFASSSVEMVPQGVYGLVSRDLTGTGLVALEGQDRAINYQGPMISTLAINGGTPVEEAILRLLATRNPAIGLRALRTGFTCGPLLYLPDADVWREAQALAVSVGARLYHDRKGQPVLSSLGPASRLPVASYQYGDGLLIDATRTENSDTIHNVVIAESVDGRIRAVVRDDDPNSPTYVRGRLGERPAPPLISQHFQSIEQAQQAAASKLAYELGRSEVVTITAIPHPGLDEEDVVSVHYPEKGLHRRGLVVDSIEMPGPVSDLMRVTCRRSVLAPDGAVFDTTDLVS